MPTRIIDKNIIDIVSFAFTRTKKMYSLKNLMVVSNVGHSLNRLLYHSSVLQTYAQRNE